MAGVAAQAAAEQRTHLSLLSRPPAKMLLGLAAAAALVILSVGALAVEWMLTDQVGSHSTVVLNGAGSPSRTQSFESLVGPGWKPIGPLRIKAEKGLRLAGGVKHADQFGGILRVQPLPTKPFDVIAAVRYVGGSGTAPELFITDDADFDDARPAEKAHELIWTVADDQPGVRLPDRTAPSAGAALNPGEAAMFVVTMKMNGSTATIEAVGGHRFYHWTGPSQLDASKPWHVGVRFVVRGQLHADCTVVDSFCVHEK